MTSLSKRHKPGRVYTNVDNILSSKLISAIESLDLTTREVTVNDNDSVIVSVIIANSEPPKSDSLKQKAILVGTITSALLIGLLIGIQLQVTNPQLAQLVELILKPILKGP